MGFYAIPVSVANPTPAQLEFFKKLSPAQQAAALQKFQSSSKQASPPAVVSQPQIVIPKPAATDQRIEKTANESTKTPTLKEKPKPKAIKKTLKQFGYDLFSGVPTTFAPVTDIPVPENYVVGPGDTVQVQMFGKENAQYNLTVTREGQLHFPGLGPISVIGLNFKELKEHIKGRLKREMIGAKSDITMGGLRSIRVFVLGDVNRPGSYTVSALSTITNALFVSGGVRPIGSLRNIALKRDGAIVSRLDLYKLLLHGDTSDDTRLLPGDVIFIPPIGTTIGVAGEVRRPAIYELRKEKSVYEIMALSGGLLPTAYSRSTQLERISDKGEKQLLDIDITSSVGLNTKVRDGDVLRVYSILEKMENIVLLSGHVQRPGGFQWRPGMRLTSLIPSYRELLPKPDLDYVIIKRELEPDRRIVVLTSRLSEALIDPASSENIFLDPRDEVIIFGLGQNRANALQEIVNHLRQQARFNQPEPVSTIIGNVRYPGTYPLPENARMSDLIRAAYDILPETDLSYSLIIRETKLGDYVDVLSFGLTDVLNHPKTELDVVLQPRDTVYIFDATSDRQALAAPIIERLNRQSTYKNPSRTVNLVGNVKYAGVYPLSENMRVSTLVRAAYDILPKTDLNYALVSRKMQFGDRIDVFSFSLKLAMESMGTKDDPLLHAQDEVFIFNIEGKRQELEQVLVQLARQATNKIPTAIVSIDGFVKAPGRYPLETKMRVSNLIEAAGYLKEGAYSLTAELSRSEMIENKKREIQHLKIDLAAVLQGEASVDIELQPYDHLRIKRLPDWTEQSTVELRGEVTFPGLYPIKKNETLSAVIARANGLTQYAFAAGSMFLRDDLRQKEQEQIDVLIARLEADIAAQILQKQQVSAAESKNAEVASQSLLTQLKLTKATGRLVIDLNQVLAVDQDDFDADNWLEQIHNFGDITLRNGDKLYVPPMTQEVTVMGEVHFATSHLFNDSMSLMDYVNRSGGMTYKADDDRIYVVRANGAVDANDNFFSTVNIRTGDTIVVPLDVDRLHPITLWTSVTQIVYQLGVAAASWKAVGLF